MNTTTTMRSIRHPGPIAAERIQAIAGSARRIEFELPAGAPLLDSLHRALAAHGSDSAVLEMRGGAFAPFVYVMPSLSDDPAHAVWYSQTHTPPGVTALEQATVTFGERDGQPFLHCHAAWREADGRRLAGHVFPHETFVAAPIRVVAWAMDGMGFGVRPDAETNFSLFQPAPRAGGQGDAGFYAMRLRPNQDFCGALEQFCKDHGIRSAAVRGGVGSVIGAVFESGHGTERIATELLVREGRIDTGPDGEPAAHIDVVLVDYEGEMAEGVLVRGENPVLVTVELGLERLA